MAEITQSNYSLLGSARTRELNDYWIVSYTQLFGLVDILLERWLVLALVRLISVVDLRCCHGIVNRHEIQLLLPLSLSYC